MSKGPEAKTKLAVRKMLDSYGAYHFMPAMGSCGRSGIPDIVGCLRGQFLGIECKAGKGKTTALLDRELAAIKAAGGTALIINETNLHELQNTLELINARTTTT